MSCDCTEKVSLLIDGELPENEAREVQRHLLQCVDCQQARTDFLTFRSQIGAYIPQLEPVTQREALNRILNRRPVKVRVARPAWSWSFSPRAVAFAALVILAAVTGLVLYRSVNRQQDESIQAKVQQTKAVAQPSVENTPASREPAPSTAQTPTPTPAPTASPSPETAPKLPVRRRLPLPEVPNFASNRPQTNEATVTPDVRSGDTQTLTAMHFEKTELLLRAFRNVRVAESGSSAEVAYERKQARQLVLQNMMLRREADTAGDVQVAALLENLEPILLDIANLPAKPAADDIDVIKERVERKNIVALLQVNSTALARALD
jgi:negative regulator of sigma E activity